MCSPKSLSNHPAWKEHRAQGGGSAHTLGLRQGLWAQHVPTALGSAPVRQVRLQFCVATMAPLTSARAWAQLASSLLPTQTQLGHLSQGSGPPLGVPSSPPGPGDREVSSQGATAGTQLHMEALPTEVGPSMKRGRADVPSSQGPSLLHPWANGECPCKGLWAASQAAELDLAPPAGSSQPSWGSDVTSAEGCVTEACVEQGPRGGRTGWGQREAAWKKASWRRRHSGPTIRESQAPGGAGSKQGASGTEQQHVRSQGPTDTPAHRPLAKQVGAGRAGERKAAGSVRPHGSPEVKGGQVERTALGRPGRLRAHVLSTLSHPTVPDPPFCASSMCLPPLASWKEERARGNGTSPHPASMCCFLTETASKLLPPLMQHRARRWAWGLHLALAVPSKAESRWPGDCRAQGPLWGHRQ